MKHFVRLMTLILLLPLQYCRSYERLLRFFEHRYRKKGSALFFSGVPKSLMEVFVVPPDMCTRLKRLWSNNTLTKQELARCSVSVTENTANEPPTAGLHHSRWFRLKRYVAVVQSGSSQQNSEALPAECISYNRLCSLVFWYSQSVNRLISYHRSRNCATCCSI